MRAGCSTPELHLLAVIAGLYGVEAFGHRVIWTCCYARRGDSVFVSVSVRASCATWVALMPQTGHGLASSEGRLLRSHEDTVATGQDPQGNKSALTPLLQ